MPSTSTNAREFSASWAPVAGLYDVLPVENASNNEAKATSIHASNVVWVEPDGMPTLANGPKVAVLWGNLNDDQPSGTLVKLPAGFIGMMRGHGSTFHAVAVEGRPEYQEPGKNDVTDLEPGSYFSSKGESMHQVSCEEEGDCILYVRSGGSSTSLRHVRSSLLLMIGFESVILMVRLGGLLRWSAEPMAHPAAFFLSARNFIRPDALTLLG